MKVLSVPRYRIPWLFIAIVLTTIALPVIGKVTTGLNPLPELSRAINQQLVYQFSTLAMAVLVLVVLIKYRRSGFFRYFSPGNLRANVKPATWAGIRPESGRTWLYYGLNFAVVISLVTSIVIYLQLGMPAFHQLIYLLPFSLTFALVNSFVEESITRLGVVVSLRERFSDQSIAFISGGLFGLVHYWGHPGGLPGVILAFFLGWLLAKSILETKGIFWAWLIHFLQDVVIITALLSQSPSLT